MTYTLDHGVIARDGISLLTLVRAHWGDDAPPNADLDALSQRIVALLNTDGKRGCPSCRVETGGWHHSSCQYVGRVGLDAALGGAEA